MVGEEESTKEPYSVMHESQLVLTFAAFRGRCSPATASTSLACPNASVIYRFVYCSSSPSECHW
uniref:Uncharacterized protein n=1 Tax=Oryza barthii TaxID=65489 RepID=A0A0D3GGQ5_9ORYZ